MSSVVPQGPRAVNPTDEKTRGYRRYRRSGQGGFQTHGSSILGVSKN